MSRAVIREEDRAADVLADLRAKASMAWSYNVASNFLDGCQSGRAAAIAYMQFARARPEAGACNLQHAAIHFAEELRAARTEGQLEAIHGKMVGFFSEIDGWLDFAVKHGTNESMDMPFDAIQAQLDKSASGEGLRRYEESCAKDVSNKARAAANARWSKQKRRA